MSSVLSVNSVSKKFCRQLSRGMAYSFMDIVADTIGLSPDRMKLRTGEHFSLTDVSLELGRGECMGLIGANGAGKSTLLKILNGIILPDGGEVTIRGRVGALIEVGAGFHPQLTGRENVYLNAAILGMRADEVAAKFDAIVAFSGLDASALDAPVKTYSSGMYVRLGFAVAIHCDVDLLLIDEILAVGDMNFQAKCLAAIGEKRKSGQTIILVSHNLNHIAGWADKCLALSGGKTLAYGNPSEVIQAYADEMLKKRAQAEAGNVSRAPVGSGRAAMKSCRFMDASLARELDTLHVNEPFAVVVDVHANGDIGEIELDLKLCGDSDRLIAGVSTRYANQQLHLAKGEARIIARFPPSPLNSGTLRLSCALWTAGRVELMDWREEQPIPVRGIAASEGELFFSPEYAIEVVAS